MDKPFLNSPTILSRTTAKRKILPIFWSPSPCKDQVTTTFPRTNIDGDHASKQRTHSQRIGETCRGWFVNGIWPYSYCYSSSMERDNWAEYLAKNDRWYYAKCRRFSAPPSPQTRWRPLGCPAVGGAGSCRYRWRFARVRGRRSRGPCKCFSGLAIPPILRPWLWITGSRCMFQ